MNGSRGHGYDGLTRANVKRLALAVDALKVAEGKLREKLRKICGRAEALDEVIVAAQALVNSETAKLDAEDQRRRERARIRRSERYYDPG